MNRDELFSRGEALPPRRHAWEGGAFLAPVDADAGGTWIAVNDYGLTVCLLNYYPPGVGRLEGAFSSRGELVMELATCRTAREVSVRLREVEVSVYRPFTLFAMGGAAGDESVPRRFRWEGSGLLETDDAPLPPLSSSSYDSRAVIAARTTTYSVVVGDRPSPELLAVYHRSHLPELGPYSVCAHREDGGSRSLTHVCVTGSTVRMTYQPGPPCEGRSTAREEIARRPAPGYHPGA
jgi:hypothetical protein